QFRDGVEVEATWGIYQRIVAAYRHPDRASGKKALQAVIDDLTQEVPTQLTELITLGRTLKRRALDVLACFDHLGTSNGPTEAITGDSSTSVAPRSASAISHTTSSQPYPTP